MIGALRELAPAVVLIDLDRLPAFGREVGAALRRSKSTRHIPIVFAGGEVEKVEQARRALPDAFFCDWKAAGRTLKTAVKNAPVNPVQPPPYMAQYKGTSLAKKLGFKPGIKVSLLGAPDGFEEQIGDLPEGAALRDRITADAGLVLWFVRSLKELASEAAFLSARLPHRASLWIVFPKQSGGLKSDFTQHDVRAAAEAVDLVDSKVCAVDADWSGLKFARKRPIETMKTRPTDVLRRK